MSTLQSLVTVFQQVTVVLSIVKSFLDNNPEAGVIYFESESALTKQMIEERGIDSTRMVIVPVTTVQEFREQSIKILDKLGNEEKRPPMMFVLDSLGMLSTTKEIEDASIFRNEVFPVIAEYSFTASTKSSFCAVGQLPTAEFTFKYKSLLDGVILNLRAASFTLFEISIFSLAVLCNFVLSISSRYLSAKALVSIFL